MASHVARLAMRKPLIAGLSKPGNGSAHYLKGTEKGKPTLFQYPPPSKGTEKGNPPFQCPQLLSQPFFVRFLTSNIKSKEMKSIHIPFNV